VLDPSTCPTCVRRLAQQRHAGSAIKLAAAKRKLTLTDLASAVGISRWTLYKVVAGGRSWPALRRRLADYLGMRVEDLFPEEVGVGAPV
jgi:DNA-binding XRE family transcriptional regulator